jgi:hypothetical protein
LLHTGLKIHTGGMAKASRCVFKEIEKIQRIGNRVPAMARIAKK